MGSASHDRQFRATAPYFRVRDLMKSVDYYHRVLGFDQPKLWGDPPEFAMPSRDGFIFMLKQAEKDADLTASHEHTGYWDAYVWINDADSLFGEFTKNGAIVDYEPCIQAEYDMKEFAVRDLDGHVIAFGQHYEA